MAETDDGIPAVKQCKQPLDKILDNLPVVDRRHDRRQQMAIVGGVVAGQDKHAPKQGLC